MKYMLLIHQGTTALPGTGAWDALSDAERAPSTPRVTCTPRAELLRRLGRPAQARAAYQRALELAHDAERRLLERRLAELA